MKGIVFNSYIYKMVYLWNNCKIDFIVYIYNYIFVFYILKKKIKILKICKILFGWNDEGVFLILIDI